MEENGQILGRYTRNSGCTQEDRTVQWRAVDGKLLLYLGKKGLFFLYLFSLLALCQRVFHNAACCVVIIFGLTRMGLCQYPCAAMSASACFGPHVPVL